MCVLRRPDPSVSNLFASKHLSRLGRLQLEAGTFDCFPAALALKRLILFEAYVTAAFDGTFALTLEHLVVCDSRFENFHAHGLNACANLLKLVCWNCIIAASDERYNFSVRNRAGVVVPDQLSGLTALSTLHVYHTWKQLHEEDAFFWVHDIKSLRQARLQLQCSAVFRPQLSRLHNLKKLEVNMSRLSAFDLRSTSTADRACTEFQVNWADRASLQSLTVLCNGCVKFGPQVMGLSALSQFSRVSFNNKIAVDSATMMHFANLIAVLTNHQPDIELRVTSKPGLGLVDNI